jgi:hypothetical protein
MNPPLFTHLDGSIPLRRHEHVAVLYRGHGDAFRHAWFLSEGIERGDLCVYLGPADYHTEMLRQVASLISRGEAGRLRCIEGASDFDALRETCQQAFDEAENTGAPAVRWLEDGLWPTAAEFPMPHFFEFHALLNYQVKHYPSVALCQLDLDRYSPQHLFQAIAVHRHLIVEGTLVRDHPFYLPAERFIPLSAEERERDLVQLFRDTGFDMPKLLASLAAYGRLALYFRPVNS